MTRLEENQKVIDEMMIISKSNPTGTYEQMVSLHLGMIVMMLADISKSLAILVDKVESEDKDADNN